MIRPYWLWQPAASHGWQRLDFAAMQTGPVQYRRFAQGEPDGWQASVSAWLTATA